jgi:hypothetical protein
MGASASTQGGFGAKPGWYYQELLKNQRNLPTDATDISNIDEAIDILRELRVGLSLLPVASTHADLQAVTEGGASVDLEDVTTLEEAQEELVRARRALRELLGTNEDGVAITLANPRLPSQTSDPTSAPQPAGFALPPPSLSLQKDAKSKSQEEASLGDRVFTEQLHEFWRATGGKWTQSNGWESDGPVMLSAWQGVRTKKTFVGRNGRRTFDLQVLLFCSSFLPPPPSSLTCPLI